MAVVVGDHVSRPDGGEFGEGIVGDGGLRLRGVGVRGRRFIEVEAEVHQLSVHPGPQGVGRGVQPGQRGLAHVVQLA